MTLANRTEFSKTKIERIGQELMGGPEIASLGRHYGNVDHTPSDETESCKLKIKPIGHEVVEIAGVCGVFGSGARRKWRVLSATAVRRSYHIEHRTETCEFSEPKIKPMEQELVEIARVCIGIFGRGGASSVGRAEIAERLGGWKSHLQTALRCVNNNFPWWNRVLQVQRTDYEVNRTKIGEDSWGVCWCIC